MTPARMKSNSWPMLAPAPRPIRNSPGARSSVEAVRGAGHGQRQDDRACADDRDAEVEQVAAEPRDRARTRRPSRRSSRRPSPSASARRGSARTPRRAGRTARRRAAGRRTRRRRRARRGCRSCRCGWPAARARSADRRDGGAPTATNAPSSSAPAPSDDEGPRRPAGGAALDQRVDDRGQRDADQHHPADVEPDPGMGDGPRQHPHAPRRTRRCRSAR